MCKNASKRKADEMSLNMEEDSDDERYANYDEDSSGYAK
jgi:hypothetical protein